MNLKKDPSASSEGAADLAAGTPCGPGAPPKNRTVVYTRTRTVGSPLKVQDSKLVALDDSNPLADHFKLLRTRLFQQTRPRGWSTIQVSGFEAADGKSLVAANLAVSIARDARQTVLLVDLDLRRPTLARLFGLRKPERGLESHLLEGVPLEDVLVCPGIEKLTLLPAAGGCRQVAELTGSPAMEALVRELKAQYPDRYVLFDTPAINVCPDPLIVAEYMDALLLVARAEHTRAEDIRAAMGLLPRDKVLGVVLNDARDQEFVSYYRYRYGYEGQ